MRTPTLLFTRFPILALLLMAAAGCNTAKVTSHTPLGNAPTAAPAMLYVADFELDVAHIQQEPGLLDQLPGPHGPLRNRLLGHADDPQLLARQLVDWMSDSIVQKLTHAGLQATRLQPGTSPPSSGWLVRGVFTQVQQGNRLRRAVIGLGQGKTDAEVIATLDNLADGPPKPFYQLDTSASSSKLPGGAATLVLSPIGIPIHFVLAGKDLEKNAKQTGAKIADEVVLRVNASKGH